jgi:hypothetical protein
MSSANYVPLAEYKLIIAKTALTQGLATFTQSMVGFTPKNLKVLGKVRDQTQLTAATVLTFRPISAGGNAGQIITVISNPNGAPTAVGTGIAAASNSQTLGNCAGTDAPAGDMTAFEIEIFNWNLTIDRWWFFRSFGGLVAGVSGNGNVGAFTEHTAVAYDALRFTINGQFDANSWFEVYQTG